MLLLFVMVVALFVLCVVAAAYIVCVCITSKCISLYYFHVNDELFYLHLLAVFIVHTSNLHYYRVHVCTSPLLRWWWSTALMPFKLMIMDWNGIKSLYYEPLPIPLFLRAPFSLSSFLFFSIQQFNKTLWSSFTCSISFMMFKWCWWFDRVH